MATLPGRLQAFWQRYRVQFWTKTRNVAAYALACMSGLLRMEEKRSSSEIERKTEVAGGNLQHLMTNSPWVAHAAGPQYRPRRAARHLRRVSCMDVAR